MKLDLNRFINRPISEVINFLESNDYHGDYMFNDYRMIFHNKKITHGLFLITEFDHDSNREMLYDYKNLDHKQVSEMLRNDGAAAFESGLSAPIKWIDND